MRLVLRLSACAFSLSFILSVSASLAEAQQGGVIIRVPVPAPSLAGNRLGDSAVRQTSIYLPPGYSRGTHRYPVVYLLHGFGAGDRAFIAGAYQNLDIRLSMDSLIRIGRVKPMIIVTPNARNVFDGSFYANSPATGRWEDFIVDDLIHYVDTHYRTIRGRNGRGIAGHSMGGFGALRLAMRHPEKFSAVYALSPYGLSRDDSPTGATKRAWLAAVAVRDTAELRRDGFNVQLLTALTAVYSPDSTRPPLYVRFPFTASGTNLIPDSAVIRAWRPVISEVADYTENLKREAVAFDAGDADGFPNIPIDVAKLDTILTRASVPHFAEVYRGTHGSRIHARIENLVLPFFSRSLVAESPRGKRTDSLPIRSP